MKALVVAVLILSVVALAGSDVPTRLASERMSPEQMTAAVGAGFWGGVVCGAAIAGTFLGVGAIITAAGAGTTISLGVAFGISAAAHVAVLCMML